MEVLTNIRLICYVVQKASIDGREKYLHAIKLLFE